METLNSAIKTFFESIIEVCSKLFKEQSSVFLELIKNYNWISAIFLLVLISVFYFKKVIGKKEIEFRLSPLLEVILNILLAIVLGYLVKLANIENLIKLLNVIWPISITLLMFFLLLLLKEMVTYMKSGKKIISVYSNGFFIFGLIYLFLSIASSQFKAIDIFLTAIYLLSLWMFFKIFTHRNKEVAIRVSEESDNPINDESQLLPARKNELERVYNKLTNSSYNEPFAMTINGDWGEGKTSFINVLSQKLKKKGNYIVFIQPMILDTSERQMEYFFKQLESILNTNGIYTGKGSPFKQYFNIIANILNIKPLAQLEEFFSIISDEELPRDFKTNKELLEEDIQSLLKMKPDKSSTKKVRSKQDDFLRRKIYIIVDDFDRVEEETMYHTLIFIKELVNFKGVTVIFLMDEQKLENIKDNKITKEYLDKFVNNKVVMSKVTPEEIFNYFLNNIKEENFKSDFTKVMARKLTANVNNQIKKIQLAAKDKIKEVEDIIDNLTSNSNTASLSELASQRRKELETKKDDLITVLNTFNNGVTNLRKSKKVVREIKEILIICDKQNKHSESLYFFNNIKSAKVDEKFVNLAILKVLFSKWVDEIIEQGDTRDFIYETNNDFLNILFEDFRNHFYTEDQKLVIDTFNLFCNSILLNKPFEKELFSEVKTRSAELLSHLDSSESLNILENHFDKIQEYLKVVTFGSQVKPNKVLLKRLEKLTEYIFVLYNQKHLSFKDLFELLSTPQRNILLKQSLYFDKINDVISAEKRFKSEEDKSASVQFLERVEQHLLAQSKEAIVRFISLLKLREESFTYENFIADLGGINKLEVMVKAIKDIFKETENPLNGLAFLEDWTSRALNTINDNHTKNHYILEATKKYKVIIDNFIKTYESWNRVKFKVGNLSIIHQSKFNERLEINSFQEFKVALNEFSQYTNEGNELVRNLDYFHSLLKYLKKYTRENKVEKEVIQTLEEMYEKLANNELKEITVDEEKVMLWCTIELGEIKEDVTDL